jgi:hypothetical protein
MRQQETQPLRAGGRVRGDQEPVGRIGKIPDKHAIEAARLGGPGKVRDVASVEHDRRRRMDLRLVPMMDHPNEFDAHAVILALPTIRPGIFP